MKLHNSRRHAAELMDLLVDVGPLTAAEATEKLGWTPGRFTTALACARDELCPELGLTIPASTPPDWTYEVTTEWEPVEVGAAYTLGLVERRLGRILRDVETILPYLSRGTRAWRRASFLAKHLGHIVRTLAEINDG